MKDLIKIAEEQIEMLKEIQFNDVLDNNEIEVSREIRNWCEFIKSLDINKIPEKFSNDILDNIPTNKLVKELETRKGIEINTIGPYQDEEINVNGPCILIKVID